MIKLRYDCIIKLIKDICCDSFSIFHTFTACRYLIFHKIGTNLSHQVFKFVLIAVSLFKTSFLCECIYKLYQQENWHALMRMHITHVVFRFWVYECIQVLKTHLSGMNVFKTLKHIILWLFVLLINTSSKVIRAGSRLAARKLDLVTLHQ